MIALIRRDHHRRPVTVLEHLGDGVDAEAREPGRHQDAEGYDAHADPEDEPHPRDAVLIAQGHAADGRGAAEHDRAQGSYVHERSEPAPGDEVVLGAAGPREAPVAGPDHDGEVQGYDDVIEKQVIHRSSS